MSDTYIQKSICEAIDIIARQRVAQANFDRTIKAVIDKVIDKTTGEYSIKYQDSKWTAYATNSDIYYETGQQVNVLIPGNDFNRRKTILNGVGLKSTNYVQIPPAEQSYNSIGGNFLQGNIGTIGLKASSSPNIFYLYKTLTEEEIENGETNLLDIDTDKVKKYLKESNGLALSFYVQTQLDEVQQAGGAYGLCLSVTYEDDQGNDTNQVFYVDMLNGIGNPFNYITPTKIENFTMAVQPNKIKSIDSVYLFTDNFPKDSINEDIFFSNIMICGGIPLTTEEINGYTLHINFPNGNELKKLENENSFSIKAQAQLKVKGRIINSNVLYYWCRRNGTILSSSEKYFSQAGQGWECLNSFNGDNAIGLLDNDFYFSTEKDDPKNKKANAPEKNTQILCVAIYNGHVFTKKANVINYNVKQVKIISSDQKGDQNKTTYYFGAGHPILQCQIFDEDNKRVSNNNYIYSWTVTSNNGKTVTKKLNTDSDNKDYTDAYCKLYGKKGSGICEDNITLYSTNEDGYITIKNTIVGEKDQNKYTTGLGKNYIDAIDDWKAIKYKERIKNEYYIYFPVNTIVGYVTISCSVNQKIIQDDKQSQNYIGTGSITLYNKLEVQGMYSLNIQNGTKVFQYDDKGNSPCGPKAVKPLKLQPLTFTLFDNTGKQISYQAIINNGTVRWLFPKNNTLLTTSQEPEESNTLLIQPDKTFAANYNIYKNRQSFSYSIVNQYDSKKTNNDIRLYIQYKGLTFDNYTNFTFPKDGDPGTNGTDIIAKIVSSNGTTDRIYISSQSSKVMFDDNGVKITQLNFKLYNNSQSFSPPSGTTTSWSCPPIVGTDSNHNKGNFVTYLSKSDDNRWRIPQIKNALVSNNNLPSSTKIQEDKPVNIIRAQYNDNNLNYFAECPICTEFILNSNYRLKVKPKTGFQYVVYAQDGTRPEYDNTLPFEIIVEKLYKNEYWIIDETERTYTWYTIGNLIIESFTNNTAIIKPTDKFNGDDLSSAVLVNVSNIGRIHIPVYMILNRYGHAAINDWDGNSIDLGEDSGMILAPQVGAGSKNNNNQFNGVLMGAVKTPANGNNPEKTQTGLFGYNNGQRSIFLDSDTGNAYFGKNGQARINIAASDVGVAPKGSIYSSGYYNYDSNTGLPSSKYIDPSSKKGRGMLIDLITPEIRFGSGDFYVTKEGHIHASGNGDIAGWSIDNNKIYKENTGMSSQVTKVKDIDPSKKRPWQDSTVAFYAGQTKQGEESTTSPNFYVTHSGYLFSKKGKIATWDINEKALQNSNVGMGQNESSISFTYNTSTTTIAENNARFWANNKFIVDKDGKLYANEGYIGPWNLTATALTNGKVGMGSNPINRSNMNASFGSNTIPSGQSGPNARFWGKSEDNQTSYNFVVDQEGKLYSKAGQIGGWHIAQTKIWAVGSEAKGNGIQINANGTIQSNYETTEKQGSIGQGDNAQSYNYSSGTGYSINYDGTATFNEIYANGGKIGNWTISGGQLSNGSVTLTPNGTLEASAGYIGEVEITASGIKGPGFEITGSSASFTGLQIDLSANNGVGTASTGNGSSSVTGKGLSSDGNGTTVGPGAKIDNGVEAGDGNTLDSWGKITYVTDVKTVAAGEPIVKTFDQVFNEVNLPSGSVSLGNVTIYMPSSFSFSSITGLTVGTDNTVSGSGTITLSGSPTCTKTGAGSVSFTDKIYQPVQNTTFCTRAGSYTVSYGVAHVPTSTVDGSAPDSTNLGPSGAGENVPVPQ